MRQTKTKNYICHQSKRINCS